jgi:cell division protein ZapA (FtsZ GTPase activity inhibitor)
VNIKNHVRLSVCNSDIVINSDDSEQYIREIAAEVELRIDSLKAHSSAISVTMSAIFAAMEYCDEATKANNSADNLRTQIKEYLEDTATARAELTDARKQISNLTREMQSLKNRLSQKETNK